MCHHTRKRRPQTCNSRFDQAVRTGGVVARGHDEAAIEGPAPDEGGHRGRGHEAVLPDEHLLDAVACMQDV